MLYGVRRHDAALKSGFAKPQTKKKRRRVAALQNFVLVLPNFFQSIIVVDVEFDPRRASVRGKAWRGF